MPVFSRGDKRVLFVHIPKTGGSSVEQYFANWGWSVEYLDKSNPARPAYSNHYRKISPQHLHARLLLEMFDLWKFDSVFTVVRDPIERFSSEFAYRNPDFATAEVSERAVNEWWLAQKRILRRNPSHLDNHLRPQSDFLLNGMKIFEIKNDLASIKLLAEDGQSADEGSEQHRSSLNFPHVGSSWNESRPVQLSNWLRKELRRFYRSDFRIIDKLRKDT